MKKSKIFLIVFLIFFGLFLTFSCDILTPLDPDQKVEKQAWDVLLEAHAMKQLWFYHYFGVYSGGYARGQLFLAEPPNYQINALWDEFQTLMTYADAVDDAVDSLEGLSASLGKPVVTSSIFGALKSFFGAGREVNENNRKRLLLIASNMNQNDRNQLYDELVIDSWKSEIGTADQFWTKLQNGDLDDKASTFYKNFYDGSNALLNPFTGLANDKKLTPGQMLAKDGINLCNKGMDVVIETGKIVVPGLGQATDILDAGKDFYDKSQKMVDKPLEFIKDEIKSRAAAKIVGMTDIDNVLNTDGIGNYVKILAETSLGTDDPQELVEKGIDYGIAKITSSNASVQTDIAIAKNQQPGPGLPEFIIGVGTYAQQANEFLLNLPAGNWSITTRENSGQTSATTTTTISTQQISTVDVVASDTSGTSDDTTDVPDPQIERLEHVLDSLNVQAIRTQKVCIQIFDWDADDNYFNETLCNGSTLFWYSALYALKWSGYSFSSHYDQEDTYTSYSGTNLYRGSAAINGSIYLDPAQKTPLVSISAHYFYYEYYGVTDDVMIYREERQVNIDDLPLEYIDYNGVYFSFRCNPWTSYAINGLPVGSPDEYGSAQIDRVRYDTTGAIIVDSHYNYFQDLEDGRMTVDFTFIDTSSSSANILFDY